MPQFALDRHVRRIATCAVLVMAATSLSTALADETRTALPPRLDNEFEVADSIVAGLLNARRAVDSTVFAGIRIAPTGEAVVGDTYGAPMNDPSLAKVIREVTARMRFTVDPAWAASHPDGLWAVFWMFQTNGCEPKVFTPPPDVAAVRVCLKMSGSTVEGQYSVRFETNRPPVEVPPPDASLKANPTSLEPTPYPPAARRAGRQGVVIVRGTLDRDGRVAASERLVDTAGPEFRPAVDGVLRRLAYMSSGSPVEGREVYVRIVFRLAMVDGYHCVDTQTAWQGDEVSICGSRIPAR